MFKNIKREEGFTLVELLVVVVILVALAAIAVPIFLNQAAKAKDAAAQSNLGAIASVIANGYSVGSTVAISSTDVTYDGDTGKQTILLGDATVVSSAAPTATSAGTFCLSQVGGNGHTWYVSQASTKATETVCS